MRTYTTKSGDTWDSVAFFIYGNEQFAKALIEANTAYIGTVIFKGNTLLNVPEINITVTVSNLPPWKRL